MNVSSKTKIVLNTDTEILSEVRISDGPEVMRLHELSPAVQAEIAKARQAGFSPVSLTWPSGQFALVFCEPGDSWPKPANVIAAYKQCLKTSKTFPYGEMSCNH